MTWACLLCVVEIEENLFEGGVDRVKRACLGSRDSIHSEQVTGWRFVPNTSLLFTRYLPTHRANESAE